MLLLFCVCCCCCCCCSVVVCCCCCCVVHSTIVFNWQGRPSSTHTCECSRAPKNRLAQNFDCRKMLKIHRGRRNNVQISKCSSTSEEKWTCRQSPGHSARCITSKTSKRKPLRKRRRARPLPHRPYAMNDENHLRS